MCQNKLRMLLSEYVGVYAYNSRKHVLVIEVISQCLCIHHDSMSRTSLFNCYAKPLNSSAHVDICRNYGPVNTPAIFPRLHLLFKGPHISVVGSSSSAAVDPFSVTVLICIFNKLWSLQHWVRYRGRMLKNVEWLCNYFDVACSWNKWLCNYFDVACSRNVWLCKNFNVACSRDVVCLKNIGIYFLSDFPSWQQMWNKFQYVSVWKMQASGSGAWWLLLSVLYLSATANCCKRTETLQHWLRSV